MIIIYQEFSCTGAFDHHAILRNSLHSGRAWNMYVVIHTHLKQLSKCKNCIKKTSFRSIPYLHMIKKRFDCQKISNSSQHSILTRLPQSLTQQNYRTRMHDMVSTITQSWYFELKYTKAWHKIVKNTHTHSKKIVVVIRKNNYRISFLT